MILNKKYPCYNESPSAKISPNALNNIDGYLAHKLILLGSSVDLTVNTKLIRNIELHFVHFNFQIFKHFTIHSIL